MAVRAAITASGPHRVRRAAGFRLSETQVGILFMLPFIVTAGAFMIWPVVEAVRMAFLAYNPLRPDDVRFVGLIDAMKQVGKLRSPGHRSHGLFGPEASERHGD